MALETRLRLEGEVIAPAVYLSHVTSCHVAFDRNSASSTAQVPVFSAPSVPERRPARPTGRPAGASHQCNPALCNPDSGSE